MSGEKELIHMTAKEYLNRYNTLDTEIEHLKTEQVKEPTKVRAKEIAAKKKEKEAIFSKIHSLNNETYEKILYKRYVEKKPYKKIADEIGFSLSHTHTLRREAIKKLEQII